MIEMKMSSAAAPFMRRLADEEEEPAPPVWHAVVVGVTIFMMLCVIMTDRIGPDWVMLTTLLVFMACEIVTVKDALAGFSNSGVLTVMSLFVVAEGVSRTGALDYYMGIILGKPKSIAGAQLRLMVPIAILSAFLNNTPIVAVMIPLTLRWAKNNGFPRQQMLIPLSYATILGGTCSLVGTSTNLVVSGLLAKDYPDEPAGSMGLFDISLFGVPNLLIGLSYIMFFSPFLLPNGGTTSAQRDPDKLLMGARVMPWSPAAGRTVRRSGLGNNGGTYLVNVRRAATGNMQYAVSKDFVVSVGDELYFTGSVQGFAEFCESHFLEIITADDALPSSKVSIPIGTTVESILVADDSALLEAINHLSDQIAGREPVEQGPRPARVVVSKDYSHTDGALFVGIDCLDRDGLLMEISKTLFHEGLKVRQSEAEVFSDRSLSVWRCMAITSPAPQSENLWEALCAVLQLSDYAATSTKSGTRVLRATLPKSSSLIGKTPSSVNFQEKYHASIIAFQKDGKNASLKSVLEEDDLLVLRVLQDSPLLKIPPKDFYKKKDKQMGVATWVSSLAATSASSSREDVEPDPELKSVWEDLSVLFEDRELSHAGEGPTGEFLTAFVVEPGSPLENKSIAELGFATLPGVFLVSVERTRVEKVSKTVHLEAISQDKPLKAGDIFWFTGSAEAIGDLQKVQGLVFYERDEIQKATSILQDRRLVQAVIARGSPLVGKTVAESRFRSQYGGAIISIQRGSERVHEHPGQVVLVTGDALLIQAGPSFLEQHKNNYKTFALVSEIENSSPPRPRLFLLCAAMIIISLVISSLEIRNLLITASIVGVLMVSLGVVTQQEARDCIQWDLYMVIACAFGIGTAMENSGFAGGLATLLVRIGISIGIGGELSSASNHASGLEVTF